MSLPPPPPSGPSPWSGRSEPGEFPPESVRHEAEPEEPCPRAFGRYTLLRPLGEGGMASVHLALQRSDVGLEKLVVIKRMRRAAQSDERLVDLFFHEARIAGALSHPNVVQVYDAGIVDGRYFLAMEYVPGKDLRALWKKLRAAGNALPLNHAITIVGAVLSGLAHAHERRDLEGAPFRIVHRDVSPPNVLVSYGGHVKVADFGIAQSGVPVPCAGRLRGKAPYMSPEQARGEAVDARSDLFSAGILLFELTTGRRLFRAGTEWETMRLICRQPYPLPRSTWEGYPPALENIVMSALARDRSSRYGSARAMLADLDGFARDEDLVVGPSTLGPYLRQLFADEARTENELAVDAKQHADVHFPLLGPSPSSSPMPIAGLGPSSAPYLALPSSRPSLPAVSVSTPPTDPNLPIVLPPIEVGSRLGRIVRQAALPAACAALGAVTTLVWAPRVPPEAGIASAGSTFAWSGAPAVPSVQVCPDDAGAARKAATPSPSNAP